jgi:hypothetical protein
MRMATLLAPSSIPGDAGLSGEFGAVRGENRSLAPADHPNVKPVSSRQRLGLDQVATSSVLPRADCRSHTHTTSLCRDRNFFATLYQQRRLGITRGNHITRLN